MATGHGTATTRLKNKNIDMVPDVSLKRRWPLSDFVLRTLDCTSFLESFHCKWQMYAKYTQCIHSHSAKADGGQQSGEQSPHPGTSCICPLAHPARMKTAHARTKRRKYSVKKDSIPLRRRFSSVGLVASHSHQADHSNKMTDAGVKAPFRRHPDHAHFSK